MTMNTAASRYPAPPAPARAQAVAVSQETQDQARISVRQLLERSPAYGRLDHGTQRQLAHDLVKISSYLAEPEGQRLAPSQTAPAVRALAENVSMQTDSSNTNSDGKFVAQGAREGAAVAGALLNAINFPEFVSGLINGVFHSIVTSSIQQMEAYAKLVADVSKSLNQFRDDNVSDNQGRDHLVDQYPDLFQITVNNDFGGGFGSDSGGPPPGPRCTLRDGVDEQSALSRVNQMPIDGGPLRSLDDDTVEQKLVPAARTQLATSRQQLLATMVMMGINRIVVTDGKISAKVMYDFKAQDNMKFRQSAQRFDYGDQYSTTSSGNMESNTQGAQSSSSSGSDGSSQQSNRDASYYSKGTYNTTSQPVLKLASASQTDINADLSTKASLSGVVEVNFKSDYLPLDKMADPAAIAAIQMNAQPGMAKTTAGTRAPAPAATPAAAPAPVPAPAATPAAPAAH
ncbi:hypothetical protein [Andreprevotia chitinilytica]|uniref:hypothetical protein n=1 Tax=Andreprevotia chitinilytica TaxID=396808 RepID=UPI000AA7AB03|nr:hypothetical protein [Andreprevotia chitinilytica]